ncbi:MAG: isopeptide-forming domain-containing fimbrial protein [Bifidobacterium sp.]|nr:isopeptide-forming domain-containing fimbrial protein [Bifidobacterium sp.]
MSKVWTRLAAAVASIAIAGAGFVGVSSAFAEDSGNSDGTVTINNTAKGDSYDAYRLLDATVSGKDVTYTVNAKYAKVLQEVTGKTGDDVIKYISSLDTTKVTGKATSVENGGDSTAVRAFAAKVMAAIKQAGLAPDAVETATCDTLTFKVPMGYYLFAQTGIEDQGNQVGTNNDSADTYSSLMMHSVLSSPLVITAKSGTVTVTKKVMDNDDNLENTANQMGNTTGKWVDSADYAIDDKVPFQITGTLPANLNSYSSFKYVITDKLSAGFTTHDYMVTVYAVNGTEKQDITYDEDVSVTVSGSPQTLTVSMANLLAVPGVAWSPSTKIVVEYHADLNHSAVIAGEGNTNEAKITFSNNSEGDGNGATSDTPYDKTVVFTYKVDVTKTFDVAPTGGDMPQFKLYVFTGTCKDPTADAKGWQVVEDAASGDPTHTVTRDASGAYVTAPWNGVDSGIYMLKETYTPVGYSTAAPVIFKIQGDHETSSDDPKLINASSVNKTITVENKSTAKSPSGIPASLPSTGGMGTTLMYVAGGLVVVLAGVGLALALRKRRAEM